MSAVPWLAASAALLLARPPSSARLRAAALVARTPIGRGRHREHSDPGSTWPRWLPISAISVGAAGAALPVAGMVVAAVTGVCAAWAAHLLLAGRSRRRDRP